MVGFECMPMSPLVSLLPKSQIPQLRICWVTKDHHALRLSPRYLSAVDSLHSPLLLEEVAHCPNQGVDLSQKMATSLSPIAIKICFFDHNFRGKPSPHRKENFTFCYFSVVLSDIPKWPINLIEPGLDASENEQAK